MKTARNERASLPRLNRILVAVDFSEESGKALHHALALAQQYSAAITLLYVVEPLSGPADHASGPAARKVPDEEQVKLARNRLRELAQGLAGEHLLAETVVLSGLAFFEITETAKALAADLIILGTHGQTGAARPATDGTVEKVIRHAPCPVMVVRKPERKFVV